MKQGPAKAPKLISRAELTRLAGKLAKRRVTLASTPVIELTPRHPYDAAGTLNFRSLEAWWTSLTHPTGEIWMQKQPSPGQPPSGTFSFIAPAAGTYLIVANFFGQCTMILSGPWGDAAVTGRPNLPSAVLAFWTATAGGPGSQLNATLACSSGSRAIVRGFQVFAMT
jgi:hypothetical protein